MTRINCVPPEELCAKHLVAEYRELPRVFGLVLKSQEKGFGPSDIDMPTNYVLGKGHVKFFYDKLTYLSLRFRSLCREMEQRGFVVNFNNQHLGEGLGVVWWNDWKPDQRALVLNRERISVRLEEMELKNKLKEEQRKQNIN